MSHADEATSAPTRRLRSDDGYVLPQHLTTEQTGRGPRIEDDIWTLRPFVRRTSIAPDLNFARLPDPRSKMEAKEYIRSRLSRGIPTSRRSGRGAEPLTVTSAQSELGMFRHVLSELHSIGAMTLAEVRQEHLDSLLIRWQGNVGPAAVAAKVRLLQHLAVHGEFFTGDRLTFLPWQGRPAALVASHRKPEENTTPRIPEPIMAPLLQAALFYVSTASADLLAARQELDGLRTEANQAETLHLGEAKDRLITFLEARKRQGRGLPAIPYVNGRAPGTPILNGVVQAPNISLIGLLNGLQPQSAQVHRRLLQAAGNELGYEAGGLQTSMSPWPQTGLPWRPSLNAWTLKQEMFHLRTACWIAIAYLSGMRDVEVRELERDCAFTVPGPDGRLRHKLCGRVFKGRKPTGDEAEWVVLEQVHEAVDVLSKINDDPTHLFGSRRGASYHLLSAITERIEQFCRHLEELFGSADQPFISRDGDLAWRFTTPQFRRTLAWHIAHQPFGTVAGARQYKHTKITIFEGYAGTSASGFAAEVAAEEAVAMLDYVEDLYRDWNNGARSDGGAAARIGAEFERIRAELGDLPGVVSSELRLRTMLKHLAKTLHPGILNDCFFNAPTAVCVKRASKLGRPVPQHNMCLRCPNARRTTIHLPRLITARDQGLDLQSRCEKAGPIPKPQQAAIASYITDLDTAITKIENRAE